MRWIDQAGYACAVGWSGHYCVTVYVGGIRFYKPIVVGSLVEAGESSRRILTDLPGAQRHRYARGGSLMSHGLP